LLVGAAEEK